MIYQILADLWTAYINPVIPDYIDVLLNVVSFLAFMGIFFSPFLLTLLIVKWIPNAIKGGKRYD